MMNGTSDTARSRRPRPVLITFFAAALLVFSAAACTGEEGGNAENTSVDDAAAALQDSVAARTAQGSVLQAAMDDPDLSLFVTALDSAGLASTLQGAGPFTVFAPTNAAFDALPDGTLDALLTLESRDRLRNILSYHVVDGKHLAADMPDMTATTLEGSELEISASGGDVTAGDATVTEADQEAGNGVLQVIDGVLMPPDQ